MTIRLGYPMPDSDRVLTTFKIPADLHTRLKAQGALEGESMTRLVIEFIEAGLEERGMTNKQRLDSFVRIMGRASV